MATANDQHLSRLRGLIRRFSAPLSRSEAGADSTPDKKRRASHFFRKGSGSPSSDECRQTPNDPRRRKPTGIFSIFGLRNGQNDVPTLDAADHAVTAAEQGRQLQQPLVQSSDIPDSSDCPAGSERRRFSVAVIKGLFTRKRKDSGVQDASDSKLIFPWFRTNPDRQVDSELQYFNASLEPLALVSLRQLYAWCTRATDGCLRFRDETNELEESDGPSRFYQSFTYYNRPCTVVSPNRASQTQTWKKRLSLPKLAPAPDASDSTKAKAVQQPDCHIPLLPHHRPAPGLESTNVPAGSLLKRGRTVAHVREQSKSRWKHHSLVDPIARPDPRTPRSVSVAPSVFSTRKFSTNPYPFGEGPDLRLPSLSKLGLLPSAGISTENLPSPSRAPGPHPSDASSKIAVHTPSPNPSHAPSPTRSSTSSPAPATEPSCPISRTIDQQNVSSHTSSSLPGPQVASPDSSGHLSTLSLSESVRKSQHSHSSATTAPDTTTSDNELELARVKGSLETKHDAEKGSKEAVSHPGTSSSSVTAEDGVEVNDFAEPKEGSKA